MNCPNCGKPLDPGVTFCGNCGQAIQPPEATQPPPTTISPTTTTANAATEQPVQPQSDSHVAQVLANSGGAPSPTIGNFNNPMATGNTGAAALPAYATAVNNGEHSAEVRTIVGLILGVIGIPASIIPIAGLALGITGLVLGTTARAKYKHVISILAIIFSSVAIVVALAVWVWAIGNQEKAREKASSSSYSSTSNSKSGSSSSAGNTASANLVTVDTPCYTVAIDGGLNNYTPTGCDFDASSTSEEFTVNAETSPNLTTSNLAAIGQKAVSDGASSSGGVASGGHIGQFAGAPAYIANVEFSSSNEVSLFAVVLYPTPTGQNAFIVVRTVTGSQPPSFGPLESNWVWK